MTVIYYECKLELSAIPSPSLGVPVVISIAHLRREHCARSGHRDTNVDLEVNRPTKRIEKFKRGPYIWVAYEYRITYLQLINMVLTVKNAGVVVYDEGDMLQGL